MAALIGGCATAPSTTGDRDRLGQKTQMAIDAFKERDPSMAERFDGTMAYAVFATIGKGGAGLGGAYGRGELFESGNMVGYCDLSQGSIGFQLGGQAYSEVIFFQSKYSLDDFKTGRMKFAAQASAVAADAGASADADYDGGVLVFTMTKGGLMYEASIGGQRFTFVPK